MRFVCDSCRAQYMISDDKVGAKGVKVRCKKCGHVITVRPAGAVAPREEEGSDAQAPAAAPPAADRTPPGGMPAATGTPPPGGLFGGGVEDDEIGAVFDSVLNSGPHRMPAPPPPAEEDLDSTRVMDMDAARRLQEAAAAAENPAQHDWFVAIDEKQVGPLTLERVKDHWERGEVGADSLCWRAGFADWLPLSDVPELASVLAPRPARPVIVAPASVAQAPAAVVNVPVESAFNAGGVMRSVRSEAPVLAGAPAEEPSGSGWKPSAASMLASLVKEENEALSKPPPRVPSAQPQRPVLQPAVPGLLDLSTAETSPHLPVAPPVLDDAASYATRGLPTVQPAPVYPTYTPPPPARGGNRKVVLAAALGALVAAGAAAGGIYALTRPSAPPPAAPVAEAPRPVTPPVAAVIPPPAPPPAAATAPAATPAQTPPAVATATPPAVQPPAPTNAAPSAPVARAEPPATVAAAPRRERTAHASSTRTEAPPKPAEEPKAPTRTASASSKSADGDDDFDELFETKKARKEPEAQAPARKSSSTYVPPAPGSGDVLERLGQSDIVAVVLASKPALGKCREEHLKRHPDLTGRMVMRWTIQTNGRTSGVAVQSDEFKGSYAATCFSGLIKSWTFPKHRVQGDPIDFPFTL
ncbi:adventurous gliding motility protein GltJ [Aggregicoccus sp. 17bor-14]|uniref:adventurous gliding motility protein GltJ n=1 Tax=Myxococcaceae TaxID=31 RepID=UPI00129C1995|nr:MULTISPECIES: adventurous gliding motility protein GltJ [Myxococcaceae]MBF5042499.1 adventurous gliding motility protein GltJ [Simulacricoccus sp. 17bor-14]MRI88269.1 adventurous gliding motility protein GltJ [Aggregicoccus sp. 17bor-14]